MLESRCLAALDLSQFINVPIAVADPRREHAPLHLFAIQPARPRVFLPYEGYWTDRCFRAANPPMGSPRAANTYNSGAAYTGEGVYWYDLEEASSYTTGFFSLAPS